MENYCRLFRKPGRYLDSAALTTKGTTNTKLSIRVLGGSASRYYGLPSSLINTTSASLCPRINPNCLPSGDQWKSLMCSVVNCVICFPGEPSSGCNQRLSTPAVLTGYTTALPSCEKRMGPLRECWKSIVFTTRSLSSSTTSSFSMCSSTCAKEANATSFESGEMSKPFATSWFESGCGSPPSIDIFIIWPPAAPSSNTTQRPSAEHTG